MFQRQTFSFKRAGDLELGTALRTYNPTQPFAPSGFPTLRLCEKYGSRKGAKLKGKAQK
jgi:hypothetical protein